MKALVFDTPCHIEWRELPRPELVEPFGVILRPIAVSPCSSDIHTIFGGSIPKQNNHILGHECVAEVVECASAVKDFNIGDKVVVPAITPNWRDVSIQENNDRHASEHFSGHRLGRTWPGVFAEFFSVPDADTTLAHLPEDVSLESALMCADVMTTGFTGAEYADIKVGDTVCVMGIGPIGLMAIAAASHLGAARILAIGSREHCANLAYQYGANEVINYKDCDIVNEILSRTGNIGPDSVIIAGGNDEVFAQAIDMVRYGIGTVSNINYYGGEGFLNFPKFSGGRGMAGKTIHTELAKGGRNRVERMLKMVQYRQIDPSKLVTHRLNGIDRIEDAIYMMRDKTDNCIKIMVTF